MTSFDLPITVRWADLDPNGHVRHSVYYDYAAQARIAYLDRAGFGIAWMTRQRLGPVLFREEARFYRELKLGDELSVDVRIAAAAEDRRKWSIRHDIVRAGKRCARIEVDGAWLDLDQRKIVVPPDELVESFSALPRTEDYRIIRKE